MTDTGAEIFPTRYLRLVNQLFEQLKNRLSKKDIEKILIQVAKEISSEQGKKIHALPIEEKLTSIQQFLAEEGFTIEWNKHGSEYVIDEITCPFYHVSNNHPEICIIDKTILTTLLSTPVQKVKCILSGDNLCSYVFTLDPVLEKNP